jgi:hypothetical protein
MSVSNKKELLAEYQKKMRGAGGSGTGANQKNEWKRYQVREGTHNLRILPSTDGKLPWRDVAFHYFGFQKGNKQFICPKVTLNQPCPICEAWESVRFSKVEADKKLGKIYSPKNCSLFWVIDREAEDEGPMIWTAGYSPFSQFLGFYMTPDWQNMDDPVEGSDIILTYTVINNAPNKYGVSPRRPSPVFVDAKTGEYDEARYNEMIVKTFPLANCYSRSRSYEELKSILAVFESGEDVNRYVILLDEEKKKNRKDTQNGSTGETGDTEDSGSSEEEVGEPVVQKAATIDDAPATKAEAPVIVQHEPLCMGEYDAKDVECQVGKCDSRKACMKKTGAGSGETPMRDLISPPTTNATTTQAVPTTNAIVSPTKGTTLNGTSSLLKKAMEEASGKRKAV